MLGMSMFDNDPFFAGHREHMREMEQMFRDPFGSLGGGNLALPDASRPAHKWQQQQAQNMQVAERNMFMDPFTHFDSMFSNMRSMMTDMQRGFDQVSTNPDAHVYQQSSVMRYSNTGEGAPKMYQASASSHQRPGGIKETRKAVHDSEAGLEKMAVGHHLGDQAYVKERSRNLRTGEANEDQEYINLDEDEAEPFEQEYQEKWHRSMRGGLNQRQRLEGARHAAEPLGNSTHLRSRHMAQSAPERHRKSHSSRRA